MALSQAPIRSLLVWPVVRMGRPEDRADRSLRRQYAGHPEGQTQSKGARQKIIAVILSGAKNLSHRADINVGVFCVFA